MVNQVFSQLTILGEKYRITETPDSFSVQILKITDSDVFDEWMPIYSTAKTKYGLKSCVDYLGKIVCNKQDDLSEHYNF